MESITILYQWILNSKGMLLDCLAYIVLIASIIIKLTPTLKDDNFFKPVIKFIGKYLALEKYGPGEQK